MSYQASSEALQTLLRTLTTYFGSSDVTLGDYRCLDDGTTDYRAIILPGRIAAGEVGMSRIDSRRYDLGLEIFCRSTETNSAHTFALFRDAIINLLVVYPTLNTETETYIESITSDADPLEVMDKMTGGPFYIYQRLRVSITENIDLTTGEYA